MDYPLLNTFWTMLWFFLWVMWLFLLFKIVGDIFRNDKMSGWLKALWLIVLIILPFLGVLVYVIVHGGDMGKRDLARAKEHEKAFRNYVRKAAAGGETGGADELAKLADLKGKGVITEEEFQQAKAKLLA
ncbi:SHOCT domain-containing protein [Streptomyces sp. A3M-1-3]|uniref:SHOCT domain-containing protein n=1 Tax=Streptomyces sp. A3M-1-3 TaxID=2962044 RepID=UPI0020B8485C|nr:SHOCT domain-containing protein [Streptomyces sp. A3M-1-3]MCP3819790.1 SHOCT domain-containing protein [Streptomyces sp. A3M-1-3]